MTEPIHVRARKFLQEFFNDEDLTNFCFDYFPQVYNDFTMGMPKSQKVRMLVENSQRRGRFDELLAALERERPKVYLDHFAENSHLIDPEPQAHRTVERNPRQIFISHAHQDAEFAQRLAADLQAKGWQTWMAPDNIRPGEKWVEAINRGLSESGVFVLLLTAEAVASRWVQSETNVAIGMEHRGELRLLPLNVKSTVGVPALWEAYQWIPFNSHYETGLDTLLSELEPAKESQTVSRTMIHEGKEQPKPTLETGNFSKRETEEKLQSINANQPKQLQLIIKQIKQIPTRLLFGSGGVILIFLLAWVFWPDDDADSVVEPTEVVELVVTGTEEAEDTEIPTLPKTSTETSESTTPTATLTLSTTPTVDPNMPPLNASLGDSWIRPVDDMEMVFVPEGTFLMGSDPSIDTLADNDEFPLHEVELDGFWIDRTEVTNGQYSEFLNAQGNLGEGGVTWLDIGDRDVLIELNNGDYISKTDFDNYPVVEISWYGANAYCQWLGGELPTEAQWEYAARGPDGRLFPWGNTIDSPRANYCDSNCSLDWADMNVNDGYSEVAPIATYSPEGDSWVGATDMAGNVWEWVSDWYARNYYGEADKDSPLGPEIGDFKVMRGGGWNPDASNLRVANRDANTPDLRSDFIGFRCIMPKD